MKKLLIVAIGLTMLGPSCTKDSPSTSLDPTPIHLTQKGKEVIEAGNDFGVRLFQITALNETENTMLSPISASTALTMLLNGSQAQTYAQIRDMLGFSGLTLPEINAAYQSLVTQLLVADQQVEITLANAVFSSDRFSVRQEFLDSMTKAFAAKISHLDFNRPEALDTINNWASDHTNGKINQVLSEIDPLTVMFLMNALYFKGTWTYTFEEGNTQQGIFTRADGTTVTAEFMHEKLPVKGSYSNNAQAVELTYGNGNFSMIVILPHQSLADYLTDFSPETWNQITGEIDALDTYEEKDIFMPKFKFEYEKELNDPLKSLGMTDAFDENAADLSGISEDFQGLFVQFVKQNSFIAVNEQGTEAAAVTTIGIGYTSINELTLNKPFIFAIRERTTNSLLFMGKVEHPLY